MLFLNFKNQPQDNYYNLVVASDGTGNYKSINEAINFASIDGEGFFKIFIKNGTYKEKVFIEKSKIVLIGESVDSTTIIYPELRKKWLENHSDDYGAAVINIKENVTDLIFYNLKIHNNYGSLYNDHDHQFTIRGGGNKIILLNCKVISDGGDALSLWNGQDGMYYHKNCYFEGYVDFVCPRGWCYITDCNFYGHNKSASIWHDGSKNKNQKLVIVNSYFDGVDGFPLGRYHRDSQFFLINCKFSKNMADIPIYFVPKNPPIEIKWGHRVYFYNCHGDSVDYNWHINNLNLSEEKPEPQQITPLWTFNGFWNPEEIILQLRLK